MAQPPCCYSDVTHYYERYANMWQYSLPPYTHSVFEYGPIAALAIYLPLVVDLAGIGQYYFNYRSLSLLFDFILFFALLKFNKKYNKQAVAGIVLYLGLTTISSDWLYEGVDLIFTCFATLAILSVLASDYTSQLKSGLYLWLSTAVKFLTLPLSVPLYLLQKKNVWTSLAILFGSFLLVWLVPLIIFRSSLSVPFVYNASRTIKYNTISHLIIRTANYWTHTETETKLAPDYSFTGPISTVAKKTLDVVYPLSIGLFLSAVVVFIFKKENKNVKLKPISIVKQFFRPSTFSPLQKFEIMTWIYISYFLLSFFTAKIYSNPFLIWILPMVVLLRWQDIRQRNRFFVLISIWTILELTSWFTAANLGFGHTRHFNHELYDIVYGWIKWTVMMLTVGVVIKGWRETQQKKL